LQSSPAARHINSDQLAHSAPVGLKSPIIIKLTNFLFRVILATVLLCSKFYNDVYYSNDQVGNVGGIHHLEMNLLEAYFLKVIDFRLYIDEVEFNQFSEQL
jgi:hypothetical protein